MDGMDNAVNGVIFLCLGLIALWKWRKRVTKEEIDCTVYFSRKQTPEELQISATYFNSILLLVGVVVTLASFLMLFSAITGLDWPYHYR